LIIFIYGQDRYRVRKYTSNLLDIYSNKYPNRLDVTKFDAEDRGFDDFINLFNSTSLFDDHKLIILNGSFFKKSLIESFLALFKNNDILKDQSRIVVVNEYASGDELKKINKNFFQYLESNSKSTKEFNILTSQALKKWIKSQLIEAGINFDLRLTDYLFEIGPDLERLSNEILKLRFYQLGLRHKPDLADLETLIEKVNPSNDFAMVEDFVFGRLAGGLLKLDQYIKESGEPVRFIGLLSYQLKALLMVQECLRNKIRPNEIAKKTGLHPFVVRKLSNYSDGGIVDKASYFLNSLPKLEQQIKGGVNLTEALLLIMLNKHSA